MLGYLSDANPPTVPNALRHPDSGPHSNLMPRVDMLPDRSHTQPRVDASPSRTRCQNLRFYKIVSGLLVQHIYLVFQSAFAPLYFRISCCQNYLYFVHDFIIHHSSALRYFSMICLLDLLLIYQFYLVDFAIILRSLLLEV